MWKCRDDEVTSKDIEGDIGKIVAPIVAKKDKAKEAQKDSKKDKEAQKASTKEKEEQNENCFTKEKEVQK